MADYISREALRDALYEQDTITMRGVAIINSFPAADVEPVRRWIPCSERLPEVGAGALVYSRSRGIAVDYYDRELFEFADVTHWMPLPEPPEEELP